MLKVHTALKLLTFQGHTKTFLLTQAELQNCTQGGALPELGQPIVMVQTPQKDVPLYTVPYMYTLLTVPTPEKVLYATSN